MYGVCSPGTAPSPIESLLLIDVGLVGAEVALVEASVEEDWSNPESARLAAATVSMAVELAAVAAEEVPSLEPHFHPQ